MLKIHVFNIYDENGITYERAFCGHNYDEPESPNEAACFRSIMNRDRQMRGCLNYMMKTKSPNEGALGC